MTGRIKSKLFLLIILASTMTACGPLKDMGKGLGNLFKGINSPIR